MSLGCARCGDCCDPVGLNPDVEAAIWGRKAKADETADPSVLFAREHWSPYEGPLRDGWWVRDHQCDRFNPVTRLCEAYDDRPPVCDGFPWYGLEEGNERSVEALPARCSFALDVPPLDRRSDSRPLIPLTVKGMR